MSIRGGCGLHLFALALLLLLSISLNAGEKIDHDERTLLLPMDTSALEHRVGTAVTEINDDARLENEWPFMRNRRVRRGFKFPKVRMPKVTVPRVNVPHFHAPRFGAPGLARSYHTPPKILPGFPNLTRVKPKTSVRGGGGLRKRWKDEKTKKIYEWDSQHGELEGYSKTGQHLGSFNPKTGEQIKDAVPGRRIKD